MLAQIAAKGGTPGGGSGSDTDFTANAAGYDKGHVGVAAKRRFEKVAKRNGYTRASEDWNAASETRNEIARAIFAMRSHSRTGDGVRATAAFVLNHDLDGYAEVAELLWELGAHAGFTPPADIGAAMHGIIRDEA